MGRAGVIAHALAVTNIEITTKATSAHIYQQELAAQSDIGPAIVQPHINRFEPGHESFKIGIRFLLLLFLFGKICKLKDYLILNGQ
jgi:hypothetical protein